MRGTLRFFSVCVLVSVTLVAGIWWYFAFAPTPPEPSLSGHVQRGLLSVAGLDRSYLLYAPGGLAAGSPLVIALHAGLQSGQAMRVSTGYELDRLADEHRFAVAYPDAWGGRWNDCRTGAPSAARTHHVDDTRFLLALIDTLQEKVSIDPRRVFVLGYANGGQMAFRLAFEAPERFAAIAAVGASLPTKDQSLCMESGEPIPALLLNGTADPINPYEGGIVALARIGDRGTVMSAADSAEYLALLDGQTSPPMVTRLPHRDPRDPTSVERTDWVMPGRPEVVLDTVREGGNVVPQAVYRPPRLLGLVTRDLDGPAEIWSFFARQAPRKPAGSADRLSAPK